MAGTAETIRLGELLPNIHEKDIAAILISRICSTVAYSPVSRGTLLAIEHDLVTQELMDTKIIPAVKSGAEAIIVNESQKALLADIRIPLAMVKNVRETVAKALQRLYRDPGSSMTTVGVTGTNGKTTVTHLLGAIMNAASLRTATLGTLGLCTVEQTIETGFTTPPSTLLMPMLARLREDKNQLLVMEVSSHGLDDHRVSGLEFDVAIFTNFTQDHLDKHGTMEAYFAAKATLFGERLKPNGVAVLNADDPWIRGRLPCAARTMWFSSDRTSQADVKVRSVKHDRAGLILDIETPRGSISVKSCLHGQFNVQNLLAAVGAAEALGIEGDQISQGLQHFKAISGRLQQVSSSEDGEPLVLIESAHSPDAHEKDLDTTHDLAHVNKRQGKTFCVFVCLAKRDLGHHEPMGKAAMQGSDWAIMTVLESPVMETTLKTIAASAVKGMQSAGGLRSDRPMDGSKVFDVESDRKKAIHRAISAATAADVVLIAGRGYSKQFYSGGQYLELNEAAEARLALDRWRSDESKRYCH